MDTQVRSFIFWLTTAAVLTLQNLPTWCAIGFSNSTLLIEAEAGSLSGDLKIVTVSGASGGRAVTSQGGGETSFEVNVPSASVALLELAASLPDDIGVETIRYKILLNGKVLMYPQGWNRTYRPHFLMLGGAKTMSRMLFLIPLKFERGINTIAIQVPPKSMLDRIVLHRALSTSLKVSAVRDERNFVFFADEKPALQLAISSDADIVIRAEFFAVQLSLADDTTGEADWSPDVRVVHTSTLLHRSLRLNLRASAPMKVTLQLPTRRYGTFGVLALLRRDGEMLPVYIANVAIVPRRDMSKFEPEGIFMASVGHAGTRELELIPAYKRIGIDWFRTEIGWDSFEPQKGVWRWGELDRFFDACRKSKVYVMNLASHAPDWAKPKGDFIDIPYKNYTIKLDNTPGREFMGDWENAWAEFLRRYRDVCPVLNLWNEPWEGGGISGWKSTGDHYRLLLRHLKLARDAVDRTIKIVAADSSHNTDWKIFAAKMDDHIDVISVHYERPQACQAFAMGRYYGKEVWDTETWVTWLGDASSLRRTLYQLALGARKVSPLHRDLLFDSEGFPTTTAAWVAAAAHFLNGMRFYGVVHPERPPFVLLFSDGRKSIAVIATTLDEAPLVRSGGFRRQFAASKCVMEIDHHESLRAFDMYGNEIKLKRVGRKTHIAVDVVPKFLVASLPPKEFESLLSKAVYHDLRPVEIIVHQIGQPLDEHPKLLVELRNAHPFKLIGKLLVSVSGLALQPDGVVFSLAPVERRCFEFKVKAANNNEVNCYPAEFVVTTNVGAATLNEDLHVAVIKRGSISVDGDVSDWQYIGAVPIALATTRLDALLLKAWFPWEEVRTLTKGFAAQAAFAYDERNLYMAARVIDGKRDILPSLLAGRSLHRFQNPPGDYVYYEMGPIPAAVGDLIQIALGRIGKDWMRKYEVFPMTSPLYKFGHHMCSEYCYIVYPTNDGNAEVMRVRTPKFYYLHPLPIDYGFLARHCKVDDSKVIVKQVEGGYIYELAIPWDELSGIEPVSGKRIKLSFLIQDGSMGNVLQFSGGKSLCTMTTMDFEPAWGNKWCAGTEFEFD
ncbi:MAG: hypothetical protein RMK18_05970 [Armatimonadota bacterium]|nr:hypothetical protein [Armatimonadota bacterium]MDW8025395.1 hypothetical protein [Armatimonadota bacterium]